MVDDIEKKHAIVIVDDLRAESSRCLHRCRRRWYRFSVALCSFLTIRSQGTILMLMTKSTQTSTNRLRWLIQLSFDLYL